MDELVADLHVPQTRSWWQGKACALLWIACSAVCFLAGDHMSFIKTTTQTVIRIEKTRRARIANACYMVSFCFNSFSAD